MYSLVIYDNQRNLSSRLVLTRDAITIGRDPSCELALADINISRKHARIEPMGRFYVVRDLKSTNGTWVNENPIKMHLLKHDDVVRIGNYRLVIEVSADAHTPKRQTDSKDETCHTEIIDDPFAYDLSPDSSHTLRIDLGKDEGVKFPAEREPRERFLRLHEISRKLGFIETPSVLCGQVVEMVLEELKADRASLLVPEDDELRTVAARIAPEERGHPFNIHNGVLRTAVRDLTAILTEDAAQDSRFKSTSGRRSDRVRSVMCVPLVAGTNLQGVIYVDRTRNTLPFTEDDLRFLAVIGNQVAINLANARLFEEVLSEKQKVQVVISSLKDGLVITDQELTVQSCNAAAAEILFPGGGYPVGKSLLQLLHARDPSLEEGELRGVVDEGKDFQLVVGRGAEIRAYAVSIAAFSPGEAGRLGYAFSFRDTTDLLHLQELKSEFIRNASHKLRTPLTILMGSLDILRSLPPDPARANLDSLVVAMEKNLQQLEGLVSRFLEFAELDRTHFKLRNVELHEIMALAEAGVISRVQEKGIRILNEISQGEDLVVVGDTDRLVQCLFNILDNAVKFAPEKSTVRIYSEEEEEWIRIQIEDEGPGIPPEDLLDIFSGFHQVEKIPTGEVPGAGLGLTIAKRIIHAHSGNITALSPAPRSGKGTLITVSLPRTGLALSRHTPRSLADGSEVG